MEGDEKPKRKYIKRRPMKKTSNLGKKYKIEHDKNGASAQARALWRNSMKVREGETFSEYEQRTAYLRITNLAERARAKKLKVGENRRVQVRRLYNVKMVADTVAKTESRVSVNMMKYYAPIMHWACIKYDMRKNDLEFCMGLSDRQEFSIAEFRSIGIMYGKNSPRAFGRYKKEGYITQCTIGNYSNLGRRPIDMYKLSRGMRIRIENVISKLEMTETFKPQDFEIMDGGKVEKATLQMLEQLQREIMDISTGKSEPEKL